MRSKAPDLERLFREERAGLWRTIYAFTGGRRDLTDDAVAEAFARALAHRATVRNPLAWMYRTSFRIATEELRRERRRLQYQEERWENPTEAAEVIDALRQLSRSQRAAVVLRYEADLPIQEVAARMGISPATVRVHLHRARKRLRQLLGGEEVGDA